MLRAAVNWHELTMARFIHIERSTATNVEFKGVDETKCEKCRYEIISDVKNDTEDTEQD